MNLDQRAQRLAELEEKKRQQRIAHLGTVQRNSDLDTKLIPRRPPSAASLKPTPIDPLPSSAPVLSASPQLKPETYVARPPLASKATPAPIQVETPLTPKPPNQPRITGRPSTASTSPSSSAVPKPLALDPISPPVQFASTPAAAPSSKTSNDSLDSDESVSAPERISDDPAQTSRHVVDPLMSPLNESSVVPFLQEGETSNPKSGGFKVLGIRDVFDPSMEALESESTAWQQLEDSVKNGEGLAEFVSQPVPEGKNVLCRILRYNDGLDKLYPSYEVYLEGPNDSLSFLMSGRKRKKSKNANYIITTERISAPKIKDGALGKVRANFLGTEFVIFDDGYNPFKQNRKEGHSPDIRKELASVIYYPNIFGLRGPRKMTVLIPGMTKGRQRIDVQPKKDSETIMEKYKAGHTADLIVLQNKFPQWNQDTQSYVLNFHGRVTVASVKNFQIVHQDDVNYIILQFGRIGEDAFTMDVQYPMSLMQAFAITLTSFDAKLACE